MDEEENLSEPEEVESIASEPEDESEPDEEDKDKVSEPDEDNDNVSEPDDDIDNVSEPGEDKLEEINVSELKKLNYNLSKSEEIKTRVSEHLEDKLRVSEHLEDKARVSEPEDESDPEEDKPRVSDPEEVNTRVSEPEDESDPEENKIRVSDPEAIKTRVSEPEEDKPRISYPEKDKPRVSEPEDESEPEEDKPRVSEPEDESEPEEDKPGVSENIEDKPRVSEPEEVESIASEPEDESEPDEEDKDKVSEPDEDNDNVSEPNDDNDNDNVSEPGEDKLEEIDVSEIKKLNYNLSKSEETKTRVSEHLEDKPRVSEHLEDKPTVSDPEEVNTRVSEPEDESDPEEIKTRVSEPEEDKPRMSDPEEDKPRISYPEEDKPRVSEPEDESEPEEDKPGVSENIEDKPGVSEPEDESEPDEEDKDKVSEPDEDNDNVSEPNDDNDNVSEPEEEEDTDVSDSDEEDEDVNIIDSIKNQSLLDADTLIKNLLTNKYFYSLSAYSSYIYTKPKKTTNLSGILHQQNSRIMNNYNSFQNSYYFLKNDFDDNDSVKIVSDILINSTRYHRDSLILFNGSSGSGKTELFKEFIQYFITWDECVRNKQAYSLNGFKKDSLDSRSYFALGTVKNPLITSSKSEELSPYSVLVPIIKTFDIFSSISNELNNSYSRRYRYLKLGYNQREQISHIEAEIPSHDLRGLVFQNSPSGSFFMVFNMFYSYLVSDSNENSDPKLQLIDRELDSFHLDSQLQSEYCIEFLSFKSSLLTIGLSESNWLELMYSIALIIHLNHLFFVGPIGPENKLTFSSSSKDLISLICNIMGINEKTFEALLLPENVTRDQAKLNLEFLILDIYSRTVTHILNSCCDAFNNFKNSKDKNSQKACYYIEFIDPEGFEVLPYDDKSLKGINYFSSSGVDSNLFEKFCSNIIQEKCICLYKQLFLDHKIEYFRSMGIDLDIQRDKQSSNMYIRFNKRRYLMQPTTDYKEDFQNYYNDTNPDDKRENESTKSLISLITKATMTSSDKRKDIRNEILTNLKNTCVLDFENNQNFNYFGVYHSFGNIRYDLDSFPTLTNKVNVRSRIAKALESSSLLPLSNSFSSSSRSSSSSMQKEKERDDPVATIKKLTQLTSSSLHPLPDASLPYYKNQSPANNPSDLPANKQVISILCINPYKSTSEQEVDKTFINKVLEIFSINSLQSFSSRSYQLKIDLFEFYNLFRGIVPRTLTSHKKSPPLPLVIKDITSVDNKYLQKVGKIVSESFWEYFKASVPQKDGENYNFIKRNHFLVVQSTILFSKTYFKFLADLYNNRCRDAIRIQSQFRKCIAIKNKKLIMNMIILLQAIYRMRKQRTDYKLLKSIIYFKRVKNGTIIKLYILKNIKKFKYIKRRNKLRRIKSILGIKIFKCRVYVIIRAVERIQRRIRAFLSSIRTERKIARSAVKIQSNLLGYVTRKKMPKIILHIKAMKIFRRVTIALSKIQANIRMRHKRKRYIHMAFCIVKLQAWARMKIKTQHLKKIYKLVIFLQKNTRRRFARTVLHILESNKLLEIENKKTLLNQELEINLFRQIIQSPGKFISNLKKSKLRPKDISFGSGIIQKRRQDVYFDKRLAFLHLGNDLSDVYTDGWMFGLAKLSLELENPNEITVKNPASNMSNVLSVSPTRPAFSVNNLPPKLSASVVSSANANANANASSDLNKRNKEKDVKLIKSSSTTSSPPPSSIGIRRIQMIACGSTHTVIVDNNSNIYSFGFDDTGQLGQGFKQGGLVSMPKVIEKLKETIESNDASYDSSKVKIRREKIDTLPIDSLSYQRKGIVRQLVCGKNHTLLLTEGGIVWSWGDNSRGQLGHSQFKQSISPRFVQDLIKPTARVYLIGCGDYFSSSLVEPGVLYTWGAKELLGKITGESCDTSVPQPVEFFNKRRVQTFATGSSHIVCISGSQVFAWGNNAYGQTTGNLSSLTYQPPPPPPLSSSNDASTSSSSSFDSCTPSLVPLPSFTETQLLKAQLIAGPRHNFLITHKLKVCSLSETSGGVETQNISKAWAWGDNKHGQCGVGSEEYIISPKRVLFPNFTLDSIVSFQTGNRHSICRSRSGNVYIWGDLKLMSPYKLKSNPGQQILNQPKLIEEIFPEINSKSIQDINIICDKSKDVTFFDFIRPFSLEVDEFTETINDNKAPNQLSEPTSATLPVKNKEIDISIKYPSSTVPKSPKSPSSPSSPNTYFQKSDWVPILQDITKTNDNNIDQLNFQKIKKVYLQIDGLSVPFAYNTDSLSWSSISDKTNPQLENNSELANSSPVKLEPDNISKKYIKSKIEKDMFNHSSVRDLSSLIESLK